MAAGAQGTYPLDTLRLRMAADSRATQCYCISSTLSMQPVTCQRVAEAAGAGLSHGCWGTGHITAGHAEATHGCRFQGHTVLLHLQYTVNAARHMSKGGRSCRSWAESWLLGHRAHTRWTR